MKVALLLLGAKGLAVLHALADSAVAEVECCVIGTDAGVDDDHSEAIAAYCARKGLRHMLRQEADPATFTADRIIAAGWRWLVASVEPERLIVFHDSLLPRYRGFAPLVNATINREPEVGVTALLGAKEYDRGNILMQRRLAVRYPVSIADIVNEISRLYAELAVAVVEGLASASISTTGLPQDEGAASYSLWRDEDDYRIDWSGCAEDIDHFIRCVGSPYRGASAWMQGAMVRIHAAVPVPDVRVENRTAGKVIFMDGAYPVVVCGKGLLLLSDVRDDAGRSVLPLKSFRCRFA